MRRLILIALLLIAVPVYAGPTLKPHISRHKTVIRIPVTQAIRQGLIPGVKIGNKWYRVIRVRQPDSLPAPDTTRIVEKHYGQR